LDAGRSGDQQNEKLGNLGALRRAGRLRVSFIGQDARETIARDGPVYLDRFNAPRKHPSISIQAEARIAFSKIIRELDLDVDPPTTASRPPALHSNRRD
jgi:hypothetical protein